MTLDKAIEVYKFWANAHERDAEYHRPLGYAHESIANVAEKQAREERQIAEWLKELKAYRETYPYGVEGYPPRAEPQFDKDINVRSKDEPQTEVYKCPKCGKDTPIEFDECVWCLSPKDESLTKCDLCKREEDDICIDCERKKQSGKE